MTKDGRGGNGRFVAGNPGNPGGLSKRSKEMVRALEGLGPKAIQVLEAALDGEDKKLALDAAKEIVKRLTPVKPNHSQTQVNVAVSAGGIEHSMAIIKLRQLQRAGRISEAELVAAIRPGVPAVALPAPEAIDVKAVPVDPADSEGDDCPV